jgi:hypothetical protein
VRDSFKDGDDSKSNEILAENMNLQKEKYIQVFPVLSINDFIYSVIYVKFIGRSLKHKRNEIAGL